MKTLCTLVSFFCLLNINAQTKVLQLVKQFDSAGLIYAWEKTNFLKIEKERENWKKKNKEKIYEEPELELQPHFPLHVLMELKMYSTSGTRSLMHFTPAPVDVPKEKEKQWKDSLNLFLNKLYSNGFISQSVLQKLTPNILSLSIKTEYELVNRAYVLTEIEYFLLPEKLTKFLDDLLKRELLSTESYNSLLERSKAKKLETYNDVLKEIKDIVYINRDEYITLAPKKIFDSVYKRTASALKSLDYDSLQFRIEKSIPDSDSDFIVYDAFVSIYKANKIYRYKSFFDADFKNKSKEDNPFLPEQYYQVFNKILSDQNSEFRLHVISISRNQFAILPLEKKQFENLVWWYSGMSNGYINLSYENFSTGFTQTKIKDAIEKYDSIGLFSHLSTEEKELGILNVELKEINNYSDILSAFRSLVFAIDIEYGVDKGIYKEVTELLSAYSRGFFIPTEIIDNYSWKKKSSKPFEYGFILNNKQYKTKLQQEDDWLDLKFFDLIETALKEQQPNGKFYEVHPCDGLCVIFLTDQQYLFLKANKLLEFSDEDVQKD